MLKTLVTAAAVAALMTGAAHAGEKMKSHTNAQAVQPAADGMATDASAMEAKPDTTTAADTGIASDTSANVSADAAAPDAAAVVTTNMVTNGPIADTPENRAQYGQPLSQSGKRTLAKGN